MGVWTCRHILTKGVYKGEKKDEEKLFDELKQNEE
jgi:hypothetical protein